jgi:hypothetical protein
VNTPSASPFGGSQTFYGKLLCVFNEKMSSVWKSYRSWEEPADADNRMQPWLPEHLLS